ncbi:MULTISPECIES: response regulator [unclassified Paenibacillus]|uniref:response regulator transcription factor n=1 Tax=unclassified Paenibacillus TaxID=185978 RepID=UPI001AE469CC|nr:MULTISPECIES: response regulator [unclassified Paenibacillus]MBP1157300.1 YesN/AraC family two-component response regulator [Paenibacillus sp. PvP091]MBP1171961.1 YesN/AraC family two-component response regulator [Paenibacillus sp. PvR098]MBP2438342.1 YesN/AraC family two-component response regulator [Paenibacillus sp. PvP052]
MKICVVDDEREVRISIIQKLTLLFPHEQIFDVEFGRQALEQIALVQPNLVFLDIRMPEIDGIEILRQLKLMYPTMYVVIISGYDDFEYARKALHHGAMDYLLKPADRVQLREIVEKVQHHLKSAFEKELDVLLSKTPNALKILKNIQLFNVSLWFDERQWKTIIFSDHLDFLKLEAAPQDILLTFGVDSETQGMIMKADSDQGRGSFRERESFMRVFLLENQRRQQAQFFQVPVSEYITKPNDQKHGVKQAAKLQRKMVNHARAGDFSELESSLDAWFKCLENMGYGDLQRECALLMALLDEGLSKHEVIVLEEDTLYYWSEWVSKHRTWSELKETIRKLVLGGVKALKSLEQQDHDTGSNHWFKQALQLIEASHDPNLSLDSVAEAVNVHPVTLSRIFKQQMGMNFVRYLTRKRMQLAKTLLLSTNKKINEISEEIGYADYPYFRSLFKKEFGYSPSEIRRNNGITSD